MIPATRIEKPSKMHAHNQPAYIKRSVASSARTFSTIITFLSAPIIILLKYNSSCKHASASMRILKRFTRLFGRARWLHENKWPTYYNRSRRPSYDPAAAQWRVFVLCIAHARCTALQFYQAISIDTDSPDHKPNCARCSFGRTIT